MNPRTVRFVIIALVIFQISRTESAGLLEMVSNYARVAKNEDPTTMKPQNLSTSVIPRENITEYATEAVPEYEDFDDAEEDRALKEDSSKQKMMKYFNAIVSLLAFLYKFNGNFGNIKPQTLHFKNQNEPRIATGKHFQQAQDRFEFPQKKFKYHGANGMDQQYQPIENYPPYDPLKANAAESYNKDGKSSYDVDLTQYDLTKNSVDDVEVQQSYSYEIPYENSNNEQSWNNPGMHAVYHPWMSKTPEKKPASVDSYQPWKPDPQPPDSKPRQPWNEKPADDFPVYHHDFKDPPPPDHHLEYHEAEHLVDEDRVSKKPYSYYFLGRKLWYVPLLFSVYFIIYIGALVLKSVARHKIQFPEKIWDLHDDHFGHGKHRRHRRIDDITDSYEKAVEKMNNKFM